MSKKSARGTILTTAGIVMLASLAAIYFMGLLAIRADGTLLKYHAAIGRLQDMLSTMKDAETGQRGYLLTGRDEYLASHRAAGQPKRNLK